MCDEIGGDQGLRNLSTSSPWETYLPLVLGGRADGMCTSGFHSRSWARRSVFRLDDIVH